MITVSVKLYGTLPERLQGYDPEKGLVLEFAQGACVADLTQRLSLSPEDTGVVALDGRVADPEASLYNGASIRIFQAAYGG
jgi:sulfur carrier protein ThiS